MLFYVDVGVLTVDRATDFRQGRKDDEFIQGEVKIFTRVDSAPLVLILVVVQVVEAERASGPKVGDSGEVSDCVEAVSNDVGFCSASRA